MAPASGHLMIAHGTRSHACTPTAGTSVTSVTTATRTTISSGDATVNRVASEYLTAQTRPKSSYPYPGRKLPTRECKPAPGYPDRNPSLIPGHAAHLPREGAETRVPGY
eukprot:1659529-Rhodomonas_salina.1